MGQLGFIDWVAIILVVIGGLNWGLIGLFGFNFIGALIGDITWLLRLVYILVGIASIYFVAIAAQLKKK